MAAVRRPWGAGVVTLIVVDAVLVLIFVILLVQAGPMGPASPEGTGATAVAGSGVDGTADDGVTQVVAFASPSRNIGCTIDADAASCTIAQFSYSPPDVEGCTDTAGHEIEVTAQGSNWVCSGSTPGPAGPDVEVLAYGDSASANGFTCSSSEAGIACRHDATGHSFSLARGGATLD